MPLDMASGTGKVSSTAKDRPIGMIGMTQKPTKTRLTAKSAVLIEGSVKKETPMNRIAPKEVPIIIILYLEVLSRATPKMKEPATPEKMKMAPKMALSVLWKP